MYSEVMETIWNYRETDESNVSKACIITGFETMRKNEKKDGKRCILTVFETIWNCYVKTCECSPPCHSLLLYFWVFYLFDFLEKKL